MNADVHKKEWPLNGEHGPGPVANLFLEKGTG